MIHCHFGITDLRIVNHVDALINNVLGVVPEEFQNMFHLRLVGKSTETNAVLPSPRCDHVLRQDGDSHWCL
jgi:hypothetical protein